MLHGPHYTYVISATQLLASYPATLCCYLWILCLAFWFIDAERPSSNSTFIVVSSYKYLVDINPKWGRKYMMCPHHTIRQHILIQPRKILSLLTPHFANKDVRCKIWGAYIYIYISISLVFVMMPAYGDISGPGVPRCHRSPISLDWGLSEGTRLLCGRPSPGHIIKRPLE